MLEKINLTSDTEMAEYADEELQASREEDERTFNRQFKKASSNNDLVIHDKPHVYMVEVGDTYGDTIMVRGLFSSLEEAQKCAKDWMSFSPKNKYEIIECRIFDRFDECDKSKSMYSKVRGIEYNDGSGRGTQKGDR